MKINIGDILIVKPSKSLVIVVSNKYITSRAWLKNYWKTKYNVKLPKWFETIQVNFPSHNKIYEYPRYKKCIKRPLRQKKYTKLFKLQQKGKAISQLAQRIKRNRKTAKFLNESIDELFDDDGLFEHEVFDL